MWQANVYILVVITKAVYVQATGCVLGINATHAIRAEYVAALSVSTPTARNIQMAISGLILLRDFSALNTIRSVASNYLITKSSLLLYNFYSRVQFYEFYKIFLIYC